MTHISVSELTIIGSDNGLSPGQREVIIWNNAGLLLIEPLGTNVSDISMGIRTFSFKKMHLNMSSAKWRPFCLGLNVLKERPFYSIQFFKSEQSESKNSLPSVSISYWCHISVLSHMNQWPMSSGPAMPAIIASYGPLLWRSHNGRGSLGHCCLLIGSMTGPPGHTLTPNGLGYHIVF